MSFLTRKEEDCNKLLIIFIHGFKGSDKTFLDFPERLQRILTDSKYELITESMVYPRYETRGELQAAVELFCDWLNEIVSAREEEIQSVGGKGVVWVCLCGHSMGGILAADAVLKYETQPIPKPKIIGLFAFDTPYYSVHDDVFQKAAIERATDLKEKVSGTFSLLSTAAAATGIMSSFTTTTKSTSSTQSNGYGKWASYGLMGAAGVAAVAGTAYMHREKVGDWVKGHLQYVGILWNRKELEKRVNDLIELPNIHFHCYYTSIRPSNAFSSARTFIKLPPPEMKSYFTPVECTASDEIDAHTNMFDPHKDHYFTLGNFIFPKLIEMVEMAEKRESIKVTI